MRVVVSVKATPGGGANSQATRYIAYRDREAEREGDAPRTLFAEREDHLSFWKAERLLADGRTPSKQELLHLAVSFRDADFQALGTDETSRQQSLRQVVRAALPQLAEDVNAERLNWVAGIHRNTDHPHVHLLVQRDYVERETGVVKTLDKLPASTLPHRLDDERGQGQVQPGSFAQSLADALDREQLRAQREPLSAAREIEDRWLALAQRNPSLAGRALTTEIILRGTEANAVDLRSAFVTPALDDPAYRSQAEHADWLGERSSTLREWYERGAVVKGDVLTIPAEAHELAEPHDEPFLSSLRYAHGHFGEAAQAQEFHALAKAIAGETADARTELEVFRHYYRSLQQDEARTLEEMRELAGAMAALETRESVEVRAETVSLEEARDNQRGDEFNGRAFNVASRTINLTNEALRFPVALSETTKARLIEHTLPALDRHLETGTPSTALVKAIDATLWERDSSLASTDTAERQAIGRFLKGYVAERWRDPETRALHRSPAFRAIHEKLNATRTPEELNRVAESFLRDNLANNALNARERNLLFFGRAPEHHTTEMRGLRYAWGLSRAERAVRVQALHEGRVAASPTLQTMLDELATRCTEPALRHYQAAILNPTMTNPGKLDLHSLYARLPPHERTYLFERIDERKTNLPRNREKRMPQPNERTANIASTSTRPLGDLPRESASYREYLASMGALELRLLNEAVRTRTDLHVALGNRPEQQLTITEARTLLPREERDRIRAEARNQAWERLAPPDATRGNPSNELLKLNDTLARLQEETQERARLAHQTLLTFTQENVGNKSVQQLEPSLAKQLDELNRFAVTAREELYRGFETLDVLRRDYELTRSPDVNAREFDEPAIEKTAGIVDRQSVLPDRNAQSFAREDARANEFASRVGYVESNARWHFDSLRDVAEPNPLRGAEIAPDHGHEHSFDYDR